jgi:large subunit ribosomal protein L1
MSKVKTKKNQETVDLSKVYSIEEGLNALLGLPKAKFDESIDISMVLGVDSRQSDQNVRGGCDLPNGIGKKVKVAVFVAGDAANAAKEAGAEFVGMEDLAEKFKKGEVNVDSVIASPDSMKVVGKLGPVLGPKGLMPNPKDGTVAADVVAAVKSAKSGKVKFRNDKGGIIHCSVGRASFSADKIIENIKFLVSAIVKAKPASAKGKYLKRCFISSTMGPGIEIDFETVV